MYLIGTQKWVTEVEVTEELQNLAESDDPMDVDTGNQPAMVNMVVIDGIVMGPTHCAFDNCTKPLTNAHGKGVSLVRPMKENFIIVVVLRIVRITRLMELKLVMNITMTGIDIDSLNQS